MDYSGAPTKAEQSISRLKEWLVKQPKLVGSESYQELVKEVFEVPGVRYCAVRSAEGDVLAGGQRPGVPEIETSEDRQATDMRVTLMSGLFGAAPLTFGTPRLLFLGFEKLRMRAYPLGGGAIMLATVEADSPVTAVESIAKIAAKHGHGQAL